MHQLAWERLIIALDAVVGIERALDLTVAYVRERIAFGKPLFEQQNTQFVLADCKAQAIAARCLIDSLMVRLLADELDPATAAARSEEHTSELQSLMRISYAVFCLKKKTTTKDKYYTPPAKQ